MLSLTANDTMVHEVILKEISLIGPGNETYCKADESFDELMDDNAEYTKRVGFKVTDKIKTVPDMVS